MTGLNFLCPACEERITPNEGVTWLEHHQLKECLGGNCFCDPKFRDSLELLGEDLEPLK